VPAPIAPPARVPVCCDVWQADRSSRPQASAQEQSFSSHRLDAPSTPNKVNRDLKEAYLMAANLAGGKEGLVGYLKKQAELENPSAFMTGLSKLLPSMLEGNPDAPLLVERVYYTRDGDA
jgi:hypothetical protein